METKFSFEVFDKYVKITISEGDPYNDIAEIYASMKKVLAETMHTRVLVDAFDMPDLRDVEKLHIGELGADMFGDKYKFAMLRKPKHADKFMENVAVNRGGRLLIVSDEPEALKWLLS